MLRRSFVALAAAALAACAASSIDPQTKASIGSVYVEPVQLSKATVFGPNAREVDTVSGKVPATASEAISRIQHVLDTQANLSQLIERQAKQDLAIRGYRLTDDASHATAKLKITVRHALSVPVGANDVRGIAMSVGTEMVRVSDGKQLFLAGASQIKDPGTKGVRLMPYAEWFTNEGFLVEQYRLVAWLLTAQTLEGL